MLTALNGNMEIEAYNGKKLQSGSRIKLTAWRIEQTWNKAYLWSQIRWKSEKLSSFDSFTTKFLNNNLSALLWFNLELLLAQQRIFCLFYHISDFLSTKHRLAALRSRERAMKFTRHCFITWFCNVIMKLMILGWRFFFHS